MNIIHDKYGKEYSVAQDGSEEFLRFNVEYCDTPIGYANCRFHGKDVLYLDDLHIKKDAVSLPCFRLSLLFRDVSFPPLRWRTRNFRSRGIGTAMIKFLARYARSNSVKRIEGEVKPHDFQNNPNLPNWYRSRGFDVIMGDGRSGCIASPVLTV